MHTHSISAKHHLTHASFRRLLCLLAVSIGFVLVLAGCGDIEQDVTFYANEKWKAESRVGLSPEELAMAGGQAEIEASLNEGQATAEAQELDFRWKRQKGDDDRLYYIITMAGEGYDLLNQNAFGDTATIDTITYDGQDAVQFDFASPYDLSHYELTLHAGEVLDTNGSQEGKGEVHWSGAGKRMYAVFEPRSGPNWLLLVLGLIMLGAMAVAGFFFIRSWQHQRGQKTATASANFCHKCGTKLEGAGRFCPSCGARRA